MNDRAGSCLQMQCPVIRRSLDERPSSKKARAQRTLFEMKQIRTSKPRRTCDRLTSMPGLCSHKARHGSGRILDECPTPRKMRAKRALFEVKQVRISKPRGTCGRAGSCLQMACTVRSQLLDERPSSKKARAKRTLFEMKQVRTSKFGEVAGRRSLDERKPGPKAISLLLC